MRTNGYYHWETDEDPYPNLREALAPEYAEFEPEQIEVIIERTFGPAIAAEDVEDIFGSIGQFAGNVGRTVSHVAQGAAPVVASTLPGVAQGAMAGAALGPLGMLSGAALGGAGAALSRNGKGPARTAGSVFNTGVGIAGPLGPAGGIAQGALGRGVASAVGALPAGATGTPSAGQFLSLLSRPEVLLALQAMMLSPIGRATVPVAGTDVEVGAVTNLLGQILSQAQAQFAASAGPQTEAIPEYLMESTGEYRCDPADPSQRAEVLWELLQQSTEPDEAAEDSGTQDESDDESDDEFYDELELAELNEDDEEIFETIGEDV
jgi:hypothetical protein